MLISVCAKGGSPNVNVGPLGPIEFQRAQLPRFLITAEF